MMERYRTTYEVAEKLGLELESVIDLFLDEGNLFLEGHFSEHYREIMKDSSLFWTWWDEQWYFLDQRLYNHLRINASGILIYNKPEGGTVVIENVEAFYRQFHSWEKFSGKPSQTLIETIVKTHNEKMICQKL